MNKIKSFLIFLGVFVLVTTSHVGQLAHAQNASSPFEDSVQQIRDNPYTLSGLLEDTPGLGTHILTNEPNLAKELSFTNTDIARNLFESDLAATQNLILSDSNYASDLMLGSPSLAQDLVESNPALGTQILETNPDLAKQISLTNGPLAQDLLLDNPSQATDLIASDQDFAEQLLTSSPTLTRNLVRENDELNQQLFDTNPDLVKDLSRSNELVAYDFYRNNPDSFNALMSEDDAFAEDILTDYPSIAMETLRNNPDYAEELIRNDPELAQELALYNDDIAEALFNANYDLSEDFLINNPDFMEDLFGSYPSLAQDLLNTLPNLTDEIINSNPDTDSALADDIPGLVNAVASNGNTGSAAGTPYEPTRTTPPEAGDVEGLGCSGGTLGGMICNVIKSSSTLPGLFTGLSYFMGLILGFMGIMKLKEHVEIPNQVQIWDPMKRFIAGGAFFALPMVFEVLYNTVAYGIDAFTGSDYNSGGASGGGLDAMMVALIGDIWKPMEGLFYGFCYLAAIILVMIGISRLLKTEQEGPRGPTGIGTIMTFLVAGALFSIDKIMGATQFSIFTDLGGRGLNYAQLAYTSGMSAAEVGHAEAVIAAIMAFVAIIGWISFIRGFFIMRSVAEGSSQASMMAGMTHILGGALAVNLGAVLEAVQTTLGIDSSIGLMFG